MVCYSSPLTSTSGSFRTLVLIVVCISVELPENVKCMMDCEAVAILDGIKDHMEHLSSDATIKLPA